MIKQDNGKVFLRRNVEALQGTKEIPILRFKLDTEKEKPDF